MLYLFPHTKVEKFTSYDTKYIKFLKFKITKDTSNNSFLINPDESNLVTLSDNQKELYVVTINYTDLFKESIDETQITELMNTLNNFFITNKRYNIVEFNQIVVITNQYTLLLQKINEFHNSKPALNVTIDLPGDEKMIDALSPSDAMKTIKININGEISETINSNISNITNMSISGNLNDLDRNKNTDNKLKTSSDLSLILGLGIELGLPLLIVLIILIYLYITKWRKNNI